ncbi:MAG: hypothetical protein K2Q12_03540 [Rickettsiales bacterium]|nr:hypothetical protein [Rickettsiales bacterium]
MKKIAMEKLALYVAMATLLSSCGDATPEPAPQAKPVVTLLAGNIEGVVVHYTGPQAMLSESDLVARTHCERYRRPAILQNEIAVADGAYAYYYCQR